MGFDAGLYVYPKYKNTTLAELDTIEQILSYEENDWAKTNFPTLEKFLEYRCGENSTINMPLDSQVNYYRDHRIVDEYGYSHLFTEYVYWCSNGSGDIYNFASQLGTETRHRRVLSREDVGKLFNFCLDKYLEYMPVGCNVKYAYTYERDENGDIPDNPQIKLIPCDGIEIEYCEEGLTKRIDSNWDTEEALCLPKVMVDEWTLSGYLAGIKGCAKILSEVDFDNSIVVYSGGW